MTNGFYQEALDLTPAHPSKASRLSRTHPVKGDNNINQSDAPAAVTPAARKTAVLFKAVNFMRWVDVLDEEELCWSS